MKYLNHVAERYDLKRHIKFKVKVVSASFDEKESVWDIRTSDGATVRSRFFVPATGVLSVPKPPEIPGLKDFQGESFHTGRWPHQPVNLSDKSVGVIGTGSSGVQVIHALAGKVKPLTVFQRTPLFVVPAKNHPMTPEIRARVRATYDEGRIKIGRA